MAKGGQALIAAQSAAQGAKEIAASAIQRAKSAASRATELRKELDELREEPFVDAAMGAAISLGSGAAAAVADQMVGPLYVLGEDAKGQGGIPILPSLLGGVGLTVLGSMEKSKSLLNLGNGMLAGYGYVLGTQFSSA